MPLTVASHEPYPSERHPAEAPRVSCAQNQATIWRLLSTPGNRQQHKRLASNWIATLAPRFHVPARILVIAKTCLARVARSWRCAYLGEVPSGERFRSKDQPLATPRNLRRVAESQRDSGRIDAKLVENFALFREPLPGPDGPLDDLQLRAVEFLSRRGSDFVLGRTAKVLLDGGLALLVVPGTSGVLMLAPHRDGRYRSVSGAPTKALLNGQPVGSFGSLIFGLAVDRIQLRSVRLQDGSTVEVPVRRNVYAVDDPTWKPLALPD
jgi:hypothetical protein